MFLFGHIGVTLGAAVLATGLTTTIRQTRSHQGSAHVKSKSETNTSQMKVKKEFPIINWVESLGKFLDIRLLMIGSILPDMVDKPIGVFLFGNGRVFTHSLLVTVLLLLIGGFLYFKYKQTGVLAIGIGTFTHLIFDQMWLTPQTLFWPFLGYEFPIGTRTNYIPTWMFTLFHSPYVYISETVGFLIVVGFIWILIREHQFKSFILRGKLFYDESVGIYQKRLKTG